MPTNLIGSFLASYPLPSRGEMAKEVTSMPMLTFSCKSPTRLDTFTEDKQVQVHPQSLLEQSNSRPKSPREHITDGMVPDRKLEDTLKEYAADILDKNGKKGKLQHWATSNVPLNQATTCQRTLKRCNTKLLIYIDE